MVDLDALHRVAVRAWTQPVQQTKRARRGRGRIRPIRHVLVFDTETTVDAAQGLLFGAYRYAKVDGTIVTTVGEGLIYADDLPDTNPDAFEHLAAYVRSHKADVDLTYLGAEPNWELGLVSRSQFVQRWLWHVGYPHNNRRDPATVVCFNAPFDLSRIAVGVADARRDMRGGFSFTLWTNQDGSPAPYRPRLAVKALDSKRSLKKFRRVEPGRHDDSGQLLDLRTAVFALTGAGHSLASACEAFGVTGKNDAPEFGVITTEAVDYCRQDVRATTELFQAVLGEYTTHPIDLQLTQAYSPASIAKAYLAAMSIRPRLEARQNFPVEVLGGAMSAFYGGRAECHVRRIPTPVRLLDFTSMYPTVDTLMGIWQHVTADRIEPVEATAEVQTLLNNITLDDCFKPSLWTHLVTLVELVPDGDALPVRADYRFEDWSIGINYLHAEEPMWYPLADLIASKLLTDKTPKIRRAVRFVPGPQQRDLRPVRLRGSITIDPSREDFFARVVEARQELKAKVPDHDHAKCDCPDCADSRFLKVLANSGNYGIYAEMVRREQRQQVTVHTGRREAFTATVEHPEHPGRYCFPPIAACITGAARLMLAMLERCISDAGGTWVFCDTDSMAIAATQTGGELIECPGGSHRHPDVAPAPKTLSYAQVEQIRASFDQLNPYRRDRVPALLKVEEAGLCYAVSAKRYAIYEPQSGSGIHIIKRSEHGLGRYLTPPTAVDAPSHENTDWITQAWTWIITAEERPDSPLPAWAEFPALTRVTVSSPSLMRPFSRWNRDKPWDRRIKPFNFILVAETDPLSLRGGKPQSFRLIAPYGSISGSRRSGWRNLYDPAGPCYSITTRDSDDPGRVRVKSYGQVIREYRIHPEHKFLGSNGSPCRRSSRGVLTRRHIHPTGVVHIGKEANRLEEVRQGLVADIDEVQTQYLDPANDPLRTSILPLLSHYSGRRLAGLTGSDRRTIDRIRQGQRPRAVLRARLELLAAETAAEIVKQTGAPGGSALLAQCTSDPVAIMSAALKLLRQAS